MHTYVLSIDQGTSKTRALIIDKQGNTIQSVTKFIDQIYPQNDWVEQNPENIWNCTLAAINEVIINSGITSQQIATLGIANQRETTIVWDKNTGKPVYNAIVWSSKQSENICNDLMNKTNSETIYNKTGLYLDSYFSASKIRWILDEIENGQEKAENGELLFGTVDTWLLWKLTKGKVHATDYTNATRTLLFNIHTLTWDTDLLTLFNIPKTMMPVIHPSSWNYGKIHESFQVSGNIPITGLIGNQQASLFGQLAFNPGETKVSYGQGNFIVQNTGSKLIKGENKLLSTIVYSSDTEIQYGLEGVIKVSGSAIDWMIEDIKLIKDYDEFDKIVKNTKPSNQFYLPLSFSSMYKDNLKKMSDKQDQNKINTIIRATLDRAAYQVYDIIQLIENTSTLRINELLVDGGLAQSNILMQFQTDILNIPIKRPERFQTTAVGAAFIAGLTVKYWKNKADLISKVSEFEAFQPIMNKNERAAFIEGWQDSKNI